MVALRQRAPRRSAAFCFENLAPQTGLATEESWLRAHGYGRNLLFAHISLPYRDFERILTPESRLSIRNTQRTSLSPGPTDLCDRGYAEFPRITFIDARPRSYAARISGSGGERRDRPAEAQEGAEQRSWWRRRWLGVCENLHSPACVGL